jgi:urocanate hydratase
MTTDAPIVRAPRGTELSCKGWPQEAALRMLMNNLDPDVAERPSELIVYGGLGKAARSWPDYHAIVRELRRLEGDETLLVQSGRPVGVFRTHDEAPRVLIANSNLVGRWATWEHFRELDRKGLMMYGQMTAGSWIYIGTQGILQGTYETFAAAGRTHFGTDLRGKLVLTAGLGGMGGAQPLAVVMAGGVCLGDRDRSHPRAAPPRDPLPRRGRRLARRRPAPGPGLRRQGRGQVDRGRRQRRRRLRRAGAPRRAGRSGHRSDLGPRSAERLRPAGLHAGRGRRAACPGSGRLRRASARVDGGARRGDAGDAGQGRHVFDYGNNLRAEAEHGGCKRRSATPASCRRTSGRSSARGAGRSAGPRCRAIRPTSRSPIRPCSTRSATDEALARWMQMAKERVAFQGLPARICWLGYGERHRVGLRFNELVRTGKVKAPIVIGRDHLDCGSVASPNRETEAMKDGSDAVADWAILNALVNTAAGATWVSFHHGGGVGMGYSLHAGMVVVADGSAAPIAASRAC